MLSELARLGFSNMMDFMNITGEDDAFVDLSEITREQAAAISELTVEDYVEGRGDDAREVRRVKVKLADKKAPLELLGKYLQLFADRVEHSGPGGGPIQHENYEYVVDFGEDIPSDEVAAELNGHGGH